MKTLYTSLLLALIIFSGCSKSEDPAPARKLKSEISYLYLYNSNKELVEHYKARWSYDEFSENGLLIKHQYRKEVHPSHDQNPLFMETNTYESGLLVEQIQERDDHPSYRSKNLYTYTDGRVSSNDLYYYYSGNYTLLDKYSHEYTTGNKPSKSYHLNYPFEDSPFVTEYAYDSRGNMTSKTFLGNPERGIEYENRGTTTWEYDAHNNVTKTAFAYPNSTPEIRSINHYVYDSNGRLSDKFLSVGAYGYMSYYKYHYNYNVEGYIETVDVSLSMDGFEGSYRPTALIKYQQVFFE